MMSPMKAGLVPVAAIAPQLASRENSIRRDLPLTVVTIRLVPQPLPPGEDNSSRNRSPFHQHPSKHVEMPH